MKTCRNPLKIEPVRRSRSVFDKQEYVVKEIEGEERRKTVLAEYQMWRLRISKQTRNLAWKVPLLTTIHNLARTHVMLYN